MTKFTSEQRAAAVADAASSSPAAVAKRLGVPASVVRKWIFRAKEKPSSEAPVFVPVEVETVPEKTQPFVLGGGAADRKIVQLEAEVGRLRKALRDAHKAALSDDEMRQILRSVSDAPTSPPRWLAKPAIAASGSPEVPVAPWADWHLGETVGLAETGGRNEYSVAVDEKPAGVTQPWISVFQEMAA